MSLFWFINEITDTDHINNNVYKLQSNQLITVGTPIQTFLTLYPPIQI